MLEKFQFDDFISRLQATKLCASCDKDTCTDILTDQFNKVITGLPDEMAPVKEVTLYERQHQPYFDEDWHTARREAHRFEKSSK